MKLNKKCIRIQKCSLVPKRNVEQWTRIGRTTKNWLIMGHAISISVYLPPFPDYFCFPAFHSLYFSSSHSLTRHDSSLSARQPIRLVSVSQLYHLSFPLFASPPANLSLTTSLYLSLNFSRTSISPLYYSHLWRFSLLPTTTRIPTTCLAMIPQKTRVLAITWPHCRPFIGPHQFALWQYCQLATGAHVPKTKT